MDCTKCKYLNFDERNGEYECGVNMHNLLSNNNHCPDYEPKVKPKVSQEQKEENRIVKAFGTLGYNNGDCKTKSDLDLMISDTKESLAYAIQQIEGYTEIKEKSKSLIETLEDIENEYEKEILRELNPNRTIR